MSSAARLRSSAVAAAAPVQRHKWVRRVEYVLTIGALMSASFLPGLAAAPASLFGAAVSWDQIRTTLPAPDPDLLSSLGFCAVGPESAALSAIPECMQELGDFSVLDSAVDVARSFIIPSCEDDDASSVATDDALDSSPLFPDKEFDTFEDLRDAVLV